MSELLIADHIAYLPGAGAAVIMGAAATGRAGAAASRPAVPNNQPPVTTPLGVTINNVVAWGEDNLFPQEIIKLAELSTELPSLLDWKSRAAQGKEVLPYNRVLDETTGKLKDVLIQDPDILSFFLSIPTKRYLREAYNDFFWFWNVFPDLIKNDDGSKIAYLGTHDASWCRWQQMNKQGVVEKCTVSSGWGEGAVTTLNAIDFDVLDPYNWSIVEDLKKRTDLNRFIYPISYPSPGKAYYQLATWDGIRTSGWLRLAAKIPAFKEAIMKNQMHIKYLIRIPTNYWPSVYPLWDTYTEQQRAEKKKLKLKEINDRLSNVENAGKSILNEVGYDQNGEKLPGWDIEVIDDKLKDGAYIEDSQEASAHLLRALGLDPTLVGHGPGRKMAAGSGSDKRIAFNMYCAMQQPYRDVVLEPFYFIARYNGWTDRYPFFTVKTTEMELETLDVAHQTSQEELN